MHVSFFFFDYLKDKLKYKRGKATARAYGCIIHMHSKNVSSNFVVLFNLALFHLFPCQASLLSLLQLPDYLFSPEPGSSLEDPGGCSRLLLVRLVQVTEGGMVLRVNVVGTEDT